MKVVGHNDERVGFGRREMLRDFQPAGTNKLSEFVFEYLALFCGAEDAGSLGGADRKKVSAGLGIVKTGETD